VQRLDEASLADAQALNFNLEDRTQKLELIADKAVELRLAIEAALNPLDITPDLDWLKGEVELFKMCCKGAR
jgi:hypothetical protein